MFETARKVWQLLSGPQRRHLLLLTPAVVAAGVVQTASIGGVLLFLSLLSDPGSAVESPVLSWLSDFLGTETERGFLAATGGITLGLILLGNAFAGTVSWALLRFAWMTNHTLSHGLLGAYVGRPFSFFLERNSSELTKSVLSEVQEVANRVVVGGIQMLSRITIAFFTVGLLLFIDPIVAVLAAAMVGGLYGGVYWVTRRFILRLGRRAVAANKRRFQLATEIFGSVKELKILGLEHEALRRFEEPSYEYSANLTKQAVLSQVPRFGLETVAFASILLMVLYLLGTGRNFVDALPLLGAYGFAAIRLLPAMQAVFLAVAGMRFATAALDNISRGMSEAAPPPPAVEGPPIDVTDCIELRTVSLTYPGADEPALSDVSFEIQAGEWVAFVGPSGSGKSTLADVILGVQSPSVGAFLVDGQAIDQVNARRWQRSIGYVPQDIYLFDDTLLSNIALGVADSDIDKDAVYRAAHIAQIHEFILGLPEGYETRVGERGVRLSGGQRQRIGIARALYRHPSVLILDEATSALDTVTEARFFAALAEAHTNQTIISIAHRMSTTKDCDRVFVFRAGCLEASGTHESLRASSALFAELSG